MADRISMDLHTHLNEHKVKPELYWEAVLSKGLDAIAITEHADCKPKNAFEKLEATKPEGVVLIPGIELNTNAGHVLAYGKNSELFEIKELLKKDLNINLAIELAKQNDFLLSFSHPWGFSQDSAFYKIGLKKLSRIVKENDVGIEVFNGMIWQLGEFVYSSDWIRKPINFFDFLEKNIVSRKIKLSVLGAKAKKQLSTKAWEVVTRNAYAIELGKCASFVTAGSDAHSADRIGSGILRLKVEENWQDIDSLFSMLHEKNRIVWSGPFVVETAPGNFEKISRPLREGEILSGLRYATAKKIGPRNIGKKIVEKIKG
jgi:histidinol phosphatase-like PHP family hydrolase